MILKVTNHDLKTYNIKLQYLLKTVCEQIVATESELRQPLKSFENTKILTTIIV